MPLLEDGRVFEVVNVIWCTGFRHEFSWIDLPAFAEDGQPIHERGVATEEPGRYFVGLVFQYSASSDPRRRDAGYVAAHIANIGAGRAPSSTFRRDPDEDLDDGSGTRGAHRAVAGGDAGGDPARSSDERSLVRDVLDGMLRDHPAVLGYD